MTDAPAPASASDATTATTEPLRRVAFLGPRGTFTEQALQDFTDAGHIPADATAIACTTPREALDLVRRGQADAACVAIESSVDGPVAQTEDALALGEELLIVRETLVPIEFAILTSPDRRDAIATADGEGLTWTTHPVAEAQVRNWIAEHLPRATFLPASSNGAAAQAVAEGRADIAAAPARAGELHGLATLAAGVADVRGAFTRFILVTRSAPPTPRTGVDRTGLIFTLPNQPRALYDALAQFAVRGVDLSRIGSRPTRRAMGTYRFYVELVGHLSDAAIAEAVAGLHRYAPEVRFLGSWPRADMPGSGPGTSPTSFYASAEWVRRLQG